MPPGNFENCLLRLNLEAVLITEYYEAVKLMVGS